MISIFLRRQRTAQLEALVNHCLGSLGGEDGKCCCKGDECISGMKDRTSEGSLLDLLVKQETRKEMVVLARALGMSLRTCGEISFCAAGHGDYRDHIQQEYGL